MKKLTDICDIQYGYAFDSRYFTEDPAYPPLVRIRDVKRGYSETYYSGGYPQEYILASGDLLIGMDGEFNIARWKSDKALLNQRVCKLTAKKGTNEEYIRFAMSKALKKIEQKTAFVTVKHLSAKELNKLQLYVPDLSEQNKIAEILSRLEEIIDIRQKELEKLNELIKARFVEMFGKVIEEEMVTMDEICKIIADGTHQPPKFTNTGIPFLFVSNIITNEICYDTEKFISEETYAELIKRTPIEIGDILLSAVGSYGHPAIVKTDRRFCFQRHIAYLKPKSDRVESEYLRGAILSDNVQRQIDERVKGIAQKTLNLSEIRKIRLPLPPIEIQNQFADFVKQVDKSKYDAMYVDINVLEYRCE